MGGIGGDADDNTRRMDAPTAAPEAAPSREFGDYLLLAPLGHGGMGVVWRARQRSLDRDVAIKLVSGHHAGGSDGAARFRDEARHAARIQHPNIVEIYEYGRVHGQDFFSMRLIDGRSLAQRLRDDGPMPATEAARLLRLVAEAIDYAHRLGVLHLDLKPANILLTTAGEPLVADFGLARAIDAGGHGEVAGTPGFMAPEQQHGGTLDARTDVYALGVVLHQMLSGRLPPAGDGGGLAPGDTLSSRRRPVPADLAAICRRCLASAPGERYASARELGEDLQRFLEGRAVAARPLGFFARGGRWARREPALALATTLTFVALATGLAATMWQWRNADGARRVADQQRLLAERRAERNDQLVALMAYVYPNGDDTGADPEELVAEWLQREMPGDDADQAEILSAFVRSLDAADKPGAAQALLMPVAKRLGRTFRRQAADALAAAASPRERALAVMLLDDSGIENAALAARKVALMRDALAAAPEDPDVLLIAAHFCLQPACRDFDPQLALARREPDNAMNWLLASTHAAGDPDKVREHLRAAGAATRFDDHYTRLLELSAEAIVASHEPIPQALLQPAALLAGEEDPAKLLGFLQTFNLPIPRFNAFVDACDPSRAELAEPGRRADCLHFARLAARDGKGLVSVLVGAVIIRRLMPGTDEAVAMTELRRQYLYVSAMREAFTPEQQRRARDELQPEENVLYGELEALKRTLDRAGVPREPPAGWLPADPGALQLPEERASWQAQTLPGQ